jgi:hypothetical protein
MGEEMRILTDCSFLSKKQIEKIEEKCNAKYVFETQLKLRSNNWSDFSAAVFYTEISHPEGSNWFGIWRNGEKYMISNAISAVEEPFVGILADNGDVIYSRHRNDRRESDDKSAFIAGGREHASYDMEHHLVKLIVSKDKVVVFPKENNKTWCEVPFTEELDLDINEN